MEVVAVDGGTPPRSGVIQIHVKVSRTSNLYGIFGIYLTQIIFWVEISFFLLNLYSTNVIGGQLHNRKYSLTLLLHNNFENSVH